MKKFIVIIIILLIIFIGLYIYRKNEIKEKTVTVDEITQIETYLQKIYMWKEITNEALPTFQNINEAPDNWIWQVVQKNLEEYALGHDQIQEKAKELFGEDFNKQFPKEGTQYLEYNQDDDKYYAVGMGLDDEEDSFVLDTIDKVQDGYEVQIIEYLEDYSKIYEQEKNGQEVQENTEYEIGIKNINEEDIFTVKSTDNETTIKEKVKENVDKFTKKKITLKKDENNKIYVTKVEEGA